MTRNTSFSCFMAVFMSYCPLFWVKGRSTTTVRSDTFSRDITKNFSFSCFLAVFMSYCPHFWGSMASFMAHKAGYMFESYEQKLIVFVFSCRFHELLPIFLGFHGEFHGP